MKPGTCEVRWDDPVSAVARRLEGFELGPVEHYFGTQMYFSRPRATREPRWDGAITLADWQFAASATELPVKQSVIGPYTLARLRSAGGLPRPDMLIGRMPRWKPETIRRWIEGGGA